MYSLVVIASIGFAALSLHTDDTHLLAAQLNNGLFRANGGCGYILKPTALRGHVTELAWDGRSVSVARLTILWGEVLLHPQLRRYQANNADGAMDFHPPPSKLTAHSLRHEGLMPYVVVEAYGGKFAGVASSTSAVLNGAKFTSDWELNGFAPVWNQRCEIAVSNAAQALVRICVYSVRSSSVDEFIGAAVLPFWALRPGRRVVELTDAWGSKLLLGKLMLQVELKSEQQLPLLEEAKTNHANERPPREVASPGLGVAGDDALPTIGFAKRKRRVSEGAGTVRLRVNRFSGSTAAATAFFSTHDGTALAGLDYESQSGNLLFRRGEMFKEIKLLIIDDDEVEDDKWFTVKLNYPEGCRLATQTCKVWVIDDDLNWTEAVKKSTTYSVELDPSTRPRPRSPVRARSQHTPTPPFACPSSVPAPAHAPVRLSELDPSTPPRPRSPVRARS